MGKGGVGVKYIRGGLRYKAALALKPIRCRVAGRARCGGGKAECAVNGRRAIAPRRWTSEECRCLSAAMGLPDGGLTSALVGTCRALVPE